MFENYQSLWYHYSQSGMTETVFASYQQSLWLQTLLQKYPMKDFYEHALTKKAEYGRSLAGLHGIHQGGMAQERAISMRLIEGWAENKSSGEEVFPCLEKAIFERFYLEQFLKELGAHYRRWLKKNQEGQQHALKDTQVFVTQYLAIAHNNFKQRFVIAGVYYWLKDQTSCCESDLRWEAYFEALEECRHANSESPIYTQASPWGRRSWSCMNGIVERCLDVVTFLRQKQERRTWLQQWWLNEGCLGEPALKADNVTMPSSLQGLFQIGEQHRSLCPMLLWLHEHGYHHAEFWAGLMIEAGQEVVAIKHKLTALQLWEEGLIDKALAQSQAREGSDMTLEQLARQYAQESIGAFVRSQGEPTALMSSLYFEAIKKKMAGFGQEIVWQQANTYRHTPKNGSRVDAARQQYLQQTRSYFLTLSQNVAAFKIESLKQQLQRLSQEDIDTLAEQSISLKFFQGVSESNSLKILQISTFILSLVPDNQAFLSLPTWQEIMQQRYNNELELFLTRSYSDESPATTFPFGLEGGDFDKVAHVEENIGSWVFPQNILTAHLEEQARTLQWGEFASEAAQISGLEKEFFLDLEAIACSQGWPLIDILKEQWACGMRPPYNCEQLQQASSELQDRLGRIARAYYSSNSAMKGLTYALPAELLELLYQKMRTQFLKQDLSPQWEQHVYEKIVSVASSKIEEEGLFPLILGFSLDHYFSDLQNLLLRHYAHLEPMLTAETERALINKASHDSLFFKELSQTQWLSRQGRLQLCLMLLNQQAFPPQEILSDLGLSPLSTKTIFELLQESSFCDSSAIKVLLQELIVVAQNETLSLSMLLKNFREEHFQPEESKSFLLQECASLVLQNSDRSTACQTAWQDLCQGIFPMSYFKPFLSWVKQHEPEILQPGFFDPQMAIAVSRYDVLQLLFDEKLLDIQGRRDANKRSLFEKILLGAGALQQPLDEKTQSFLKTIGGLAQHVMVQEKIDSLVGPMLRFSEQSVCACWLHTFKICPELLCQALIKDRIALNDALREYVAFGCVKALRGIPDHTHCRLLNQYLLMRCTSAEEALDFYQKIKRLQWGALLDEQGHTPLENILLKSCNIKRLQDARAWLDIGHPVIKIPSGMNLVALTYANGYRGLAQRIEELEKKQQQQVRAFEQSHPEEAALGDFFFGSYVRRPAELLMSAIGVIPRRTEKSALKP